MKHTSTKILVWVALLLVFLMPARAQPLTGGGQIYENLTFYNPVHVYNTTYLTFQGVTFLSNVTVNISANGTIFRDSYFNGTSIIAIDLDGNNTLFDGNIFTNITFTESGVNNSCVNGSYWDITYTGSVPCEPPTPNYVRVINTTRMWNDAPVPVEVGCTDPGTIGTGWVSGTGPDGAFEINATVFNTTAVRGEKFANLTANHTTGLHNITEIYCSDNDENIVYMAFNISFLVNDRPEFPPAVTNLTMDAIGELFIRWNWTNPPNDGNYNLTRIFIDNVEVANTSNSSYTGVFLENTTHTISLRTVDIYGRVNNTHPQNNTNTTPLTPPSQVGSLSSFFQGLTSIRIDWFPPGEVDYNHTEIWLDGVNVLNTTSTTYMASGLTSSTSYTFSLRTVDHLGNINTTAKVLVVSTTDPSSGSGGGGGAPPAEPEVNITELNITELNITELNITEEEVPEEDEVAVDEEGMPEDLPSATDLITGAVAFPQGVPPVFFFGEVLGIGGTNLETLLDVLLMGAAAVLVVVLIRTIRRKRRSRHG